MNKHTIGTTKGRRGADADAPMIACAGCGGSTGTPPFSCIACGATTWGPGNVTQSRPLPEGAVA